MCLGLPHLIFRDTDGRSYRWLVQTKARLNAFLQGDFTGLIRHWRKEYGKPTSRKHTSRLDTRE